MNNEVLREPYWALLNGFVFFFRDDPGEIAAGLEAASSTLLRLTEAEGRTDGKGSPGEEVLHKAAVKLSAALQESDFQRTLKLSVSDASKTAVQTSSFLFMASAPSAMKAINLPNFVYVEFPLGVPETSIADVFRETFEAAPFFLGLGGKVIATNEELFPKSGAEAVSALRNLDVYCKRADDTWLNPEYRAALARSTRQPLEGPNQHIALRHDLVEQLFPGETWREGPGEPVRSNSGSVLYHANTRDELRALAAFLRPFIVSLGKPRMFWKDPAWNEWRRRVLFE